MKKIYLACYFKEVDGFSLPDLFSLLFFTINTIFTMFVCSRLWIFRERFPIKERSPILNISVLFFINL